MLTFALVLALTSADLDRGRAAAASIRAYDARRFAQAEEIALQMAAQYPDDTIALTLIGAARVRQNNLVGAAEIFRIYTERHPFEAIGHFYLGLTHHLLGNRQKAVEAYWTALLMDPALAPARANLGQLGGI